MALITLIGLVAACSRQDSTANPKASPASAPQILRISQRNEPADLDPATATLPDEFFIIRALSEGLYAPDPKSGAPLPAAAESCSISPDGLVYTFHLRQTTWSNGSPVTADDFVASYRRVLTPGTAATKADLFFAVKNARAFATGAVTDFSAVGIRAVNARMLVVTLERPTPRFLHYVASGPWIPVHPSTVERHGRQWTQPGRYVGNGPFVLDEWTPQQRIVVKKNPRYRAAAGVALAQIEFLRFDSGDTEERAYRAGQVDVTMAVPQTKIEVYAKERPAELHRSAVAETRYLTFNLRRSALADTRVRQALSLALDRTRLVERVVLGGQEPAWRLVPPSLRSPGVAPLAAPAYDNPAEARRLLAAAGFPEGRGFPKLELTAWSPSQTAVLEAIQAMWRQELGIEIAIAIREAKVHLAALHASDYDISFVTTVAQLDVADPFALLANFTTGADNNFPHWQSPEYDRLLAEAAVQRDEIAQASLLARAETLLLGTMPVAPLYFNTRNWLMSPRVKGWQEDPLWTTRDYAALRME